MDLDLTKHVRPGDLVVWGQACGEPRTLTEALLAQRHRVGPFRCFLGIPAGRTVLPEHADMIDFISYTGAGGNRKLAEASALNVLALHYSALPWALSEGPLAADVALVQVAPQGADGRYPLGLSEDYLAAAVDAARVVIAEVNDAVPDVPGGRRLAPDEIDAMVHTSRPPAEFPPREPDENTRAIAANVAGLVRDGATLQFGVGGLPDAVLPLLTEHRDLAVHSGLFGDAAMELIQAGAVTGPAVTGMLTGSAKLFSFAHGNSRLWLADARYTHAHHVLRELPRFTAINAALEVDLGGAVNSEVAGGRYVGAVGGAVDFLRGAAAAPDGMPIVALPSSGIVPELTGPTSTARADAGVIVTERGVADLRGRTIAERRQLLLAIAAPGLSA